MPLRQRSDLGQVGYADHLGLAGELAQPRPDRTGGVTADPGVDLVEHQRDPLRGPWAALRIASITRESSPPEAISRTGPPGTPGFGAITNSTASPPLGPTSQPLSTTSKPACGIASVASWAATPRERPQPSCALA